MNCGLDLHIGSISKLANESQIMEFENLVKIDLNEEEEEHLDAGALNEI